MYCLIVDDDPDSRQIAQKIVSDRLGYPTVTAKSADDAFEIAKQKLPKLVLLDRQMPGMDAIRFIRLLKCLALGRYVAIVMCTCDNSPRGVQEAISAGASGYLIKPFGEKDLMRQLAKLGIGRANDLA